MYDCSTLSITIGQLKPLDFVHEVKIESTWQKFTDTATITLPRKIRVLSEGTEQALPELIRVGDAVSISYGYDGQLRPEFTGYVSELKPGTPFSIECEDQMWLLKRKALNKAWRKVSLLELLTYVLAENGLQAIPVLELGSLQLGKYTIKAATGAQVFDALKTQFGISCFFRRGVLVAGAPYGTNTKPAEHRYGFAQNIISSELAYSQAADVAIHYKGISHLPGGKKIEIDFAGSTKSSPKKGTKAHPVEVGLTVNSFSKGVPKGELRTINAVGLNELELRAFVAAEAKRLTYDGYKGGLTGFNLPLAEHGDIAIITDAEYPERAGSYYIDAVSKTFGVNGSRRTIKLGPKA